MSKQLSNCICNPSVIPSLWAFVARKTPASHFAWESYFCQDCYHQAGARALFHSQVSYGRTQTMNLCVPRVRMSKGNVFPLDRIKLPAPFTIYETSGRSLHSQTRRKVLELENGPLWPTLGQVSDFPSAAPYTLHHAGPPL